jgi:hypothetical protein
MSLFADELSARRGARGEKEGQSDPSIFSAESSARRKRDEKRKKSTTWKSFLLFANWRREFRKSAAHKCTAK